MRYIYHIRQVIANFVLKFEIFSYHGNRVGLGKFVWHLKCADSEYPLTGAGIWVICLHNLSYSYFCFEICKFSVPWQQGSVEQFLTVSFKHADPQNPYWMQVYGWYLLRKASYCQFCVKICNFSLPWQQLRSVQIRLTSLNVPTLNTPKLVQISGLCVLYNLSYSLFCAEFANIRYHGNRGQSEQFLSPLNRPTHKTPYLVQVYGLYLLSKASYCQFCVEICDFSFPWQRGRSEQIFAYTGLFAVPENPTLERKITTLSYTEPEL